MQKIVEKLMAESLTIKKQFIHENRDQLIHLAEKITYAFTIDRKLLICGNGGSAADAQHFVAELVGRMGVERLALPAIALSSNSSIVTALGNDYGYENVFARQIDALGEAGDTLIVISTSGFSPNVLKAIEIARRKDLVTLALVGRGGSPLLEHCNVCIHIPSSNPQRVQELHMAVLHIICEHIETQLVQTA